MSSLTKERRYDIDTIRVIAIALLLIYHIAIGFQPWGSMIGFIANKKSWDSLWIPMSMLNVWRIPLLFFVSGMGVYFAIQSRTWLQLVKERTLRIWVPYLFGAVAIVPLHMYLWQLSNDMKLTYIPNPAHLWFLGNIMLYVVVTLPLIIHLKNTPDGVVGRGIRKVLSHPAGLLVVMSLFVIEALVINPRPFELYAMTLHGLVLGLLAFVCGFCFVFSGAGFLNMIIRWRWIFVVAAFGMFLYRIMYLKLNTPAYLSSVESNLWIFSVFAFGRLYLNRPWRGLNYLSEAAYPVYILHMVFLYAASWLIFPVDIPVYLQFVLVLLFTTGGCMLMYEYVIRRVNFLRVLFGLKVKRNRMPAVPGQTVMPGSNPV